VGLLNREPEPEPDASRGAKIVLVSIAAALALAAAIWLVVRPKAPEGPTRTFASPALGCRFEYPPELLAGPNFVRTGAGAFLTVERHSLHEAKEEFVMGLPDVLYPQVRIQLDQAYRELEETSRRATLLGGRPALHVELQGRASQAKRTTRIAVDIAATEDWVYVLRAYSPDPTPPEDDEAFDLVRKTFAFLPEGQGRAGS